MTKAAKTIGKIIATMAPKTAIVLGSGLGSLVDDLEEAVRIPFSKLHGFGQSAVSGHEGALMAGYLGGKPVVMLSGRVHYYESGDARAMRIPIKTLRDLGIENLILTNAAGSLRDDLTPGSVMRISDHINFSGYNPLIGEKGDDRFVGMTSAYDEGLANAMIGAAKSLDIALAHGTYMWFSGPSFETPAEVRMARILGADAVGMSTVPEVIMARFFKLKVCAASVITNYGAGITGRELSHAETKEMAPLGGAHLRAILTAMIAEL